MLEQMINRAIDRRIASLYPHLLLPAMLRGRIAGMSEQGDGWYSYIVRIIDKNGDDIARFPEIPGVYSRLALKSGDVVAVGLLGGELDPFIVGEAG